MVTQRISSKVTNPFHTLSSMSRQVLPSRTYALIGIVLAGLLAKLPGLVPSLSPSTTVPWELTKRVLAAGQRKAAALKTAVVALRLTGIMVAAAYAGMPLVAHAPAAQPPVRGFPANASAPFFPYLVSGSDYPAPDNLTLGGNLSLPRLAVTSVAGIPSYQLLAISTQGGTSTPLLVTGEYSEALARSIDDGCPSHPSPGRGNSTPCAPPSLPLLWGSPISLTVSGTPVSLSSPVTGDAFSVSGSLWAIALSSGGTTSLYVSNESGANWSRVAQVPGSAPSLDILSGRVFLSAEGPTTLATVEVLPDLSVRTAALLASQVPTTSFLGSAFVALPSTGAGNLDLGLLTVVANHTVLFARSNDSGIDWNITSVGTAPNGTGNPLFDRIGQTALFMPGGTPGDVAAVASGDRVFALWTASVGDGVDAVTAVSPDGGASWLGPYLSNAPLSVGDPVLTVLPAGDIVAAWRSGTGAVSFLPYAPDGRPIENVQTLPSTGTGVGGGIGFAADPLERLLFAWPSANGSTLEVTGGFLSPASVVDNWLSAAGALLPSDFSVPTTDDNSSANNSTQQALVGKLTALLHQVSSPGELTGPIEKIEQDLYPKVTSLPLLLGCTGSVPVCGHLHEGENQPWIVNESGPFSPNTYLAIYAMWALEALGVEVIVPPAAAPGDYEYSATEAVSWDPCHGASSCTVDNHTLTLLSDSVGTRAFTLTANLTDPTTLTLNLSVFFPTLSLGVGGDNCSNSGGSAITASPEKVAYSVGLKELALSSGGPGGLTREPLLNRQVVVNYFNFTKDYTNASVLAQLAGLNAAFLPDPTLANLSVSATALYGPTNHSFGVSRTCRVVLADLALPGGGFSTPFFGVPLGERLSPNPPLVQESPQGTTTFPITIHANASIPSELFANATGPSQSPPAEFVNTTYANLVNATRDLAPGTYDLSGKVQTGAGGSSITTAAQQLPVSGNTVSAPLTVPFSCPITVVNVNIRVSGLTVSEIGETSASVTWTTNVPTLSEVSVVEVGVGQVYHTELSGLASSHSLPLNGLDPFSFYTVSVGAILPSTGCLVVQTSPVSATFHTLATFPVSEKDLPYDSITQEGGGALVSFDLPELSTFSFQSGYLQYAAPPSPPTNVPLTTLIPVSYQVSPETFVENLSVLTPDTPYTVYVYLNLSISVKGQTYPLTATGVWGFTYLKDTSGDGLSDAEKNLGWYVSYTAASGRTQFAQETADPSRYSTNGLVSDYVAKEFGLNPNTIDTAGSHVLDTWNMTFDLGPATSASLPSLGFEYWYENGTSSSPGLDPFAGCGSTTYACPSPRWEASNISYGSGADDSPWASEHLWSASALQKLQALVSDEQVGWLRAVTGTYDGERTMTVWGKLSWGANPLAASTYGDGIVDGARIDPLGPTDLQVTINYWDAANVGAGYGAGVFVCGQEPGDSTCTRYASYTDPELSGSSNSHLSIGQIVVTFPVDGTRQFAQFNLTLLLNSGTKKTPSYSSVVETGPVTADLANPSLQTRLVTGTDSQVSPVTGDISFSWQPVSVSAKAPTYLWVPGDNSTLSNLPTGLQRYTGEQNFDLLVVNDTAGPHNFAQGVTVGGVPNPGDHGSYTVSLQPGLTNILVPRGAFLSSPLGQALLNGTNETLPVSHDRGILTWTPWAWNDRVEGLLGITPTSPDYISVFSGTSQSCSSINCGGVPSNPALETSCAGCAAQAVQSVVWVNISELASTNFSQVGGQQELTDLLGGLLLNSSGNVTGSLRPVTSELPTLGLSRQVMGALANVALPNDGGYPAPPANVQAPPKEEQWWQVPGTVLWNAVSGVVGLVSVAWDATAAAAEYLANAAGVLLTDLGITALVDQAVAALKTVASAMEAALQALLAFVKAAIVTFLKQAFAALSNEMTQLSKTYASPIFSGLQSGSGLGAAVFGGQMLFLLTVGATMTTVLFIALGLVSAVSFGVGDVVLLVIPLLITLLFQALGSNTPLGTYGGALIGQPFGQALWQGVFPPLHDLINSTASAQHITLDSTAQQSADQTIANIRTSSDLTAGFLGFGVAAGLAVSKLGSLAKVLLAGLGLGMGIAAFYLFWYLDTTTQSNEQITSADGQAADVISGAEAFVGSLLVILALTTSGLPPPAEIVFTLILILLGITLAADLALYVNGFLASQ